MDNNTVLLFTRNGLGHAPEDLEKKLTVKFLSLIKDANILPAKILFYTDGVKLACQGSPVINVLQEMEKKGVEMVLCSTCLDYFGLVDKVEVGIVGGMPDIIEAMQRAGKVISL
jgi:selenium metabolism protein YedF